MRINTTTLVCLSALPLWLLVRYAQSNPHATELYYSKYYYLFVLKINQTLLGKIPFSIGDILYLTIFALLIQFFIKKIPIISSLLLITVSFDPPMLLAIIGFPIDWASTEILPKASGSIEAETTTSDKE